MGKIVEAVTRTVTVSETVHVVTLTTEQLDKLASLLAYMHHHWCEGTFGPVVGSIITASTYKDYLEASAAASFSRSF